MKFNELQKYLLKVYALVIIFITIFVPVTNSNLNGFGFILLSDYTNSVNISLLLVEYLALTLAFIALVLATSGDKKIK